MPATLVNRVPSTLKPNNHPCRAAGADLRR
jgi:hypothetical protein